MRKIVLAAAAAFVFASPVLAADAGVRPLQREWTFDGILGKFDKQQLQRGFQVYKEVCAACHAMEYLAFRNLADIGYSEDQVKVIAAEYEVTDGPDENGDMFQRPARGSDLFPKPFANPQLARASNGGALPPDLSLMTKARDDGPNYVYSLMMGYVDPPQGFELSPGMSYNTYFPGHQIAMPAQISDDRVTYADGTPATAEQITADVTAFLHWAAEPKLEVRHATGIRVMLFALLFTVLAYFLKRRIWARLENH
jgi:ubiquinol-cytochrome c reductase cytochrome c1 subunit